MAEDSTPISNSDGVFDIIPPQKQAADPTSRPGVTGPIPQPDPMLNPPPTTDDATVDTGTPNISEPADNNTNGGVVASDSNVDESTKANLTNVNTPSEEPVNITQENANDEEVNSTDNSVTSENASIEESPPSVTGSFIEPTSETENQASSTDSSSDNSIPVTNLSNTVVNPSPPLEKPSDQTLASLGLTSASNDEMSDDSSPDIASSVPSPVVTNPMVNNDSGHNPAITARPKSNKLLILILSVLIVLAIVLLVFVFITKK